MPSLAVSFCNARRDGVPLVAVVDSDSGEQLPLSLPRGDLVSACGLACSADALFAVCTARNGTSYVAAFARPGYELHGFFRLPGTLDVHSLALDGDAVIVASTGSDEVVRLELGRSIPEVLWRAGAARSDTQHVNGVAWIGGHLICSGFGPRAERRWSSATDGFIYDVSAGRRIAGGIYQPHSVTDDAGAIVFCESSRAAVRTLTHVIVRVDGYARGLAVDAFGCLYAGSSVGRHAATDGIVHNPDEGGARTGRCAITIVERPNGASRALDLPGFTDEIYDIVVLG